MRLHWLLVGSVLLAFGCGDDSGGLPPDRDPPTILALTPLPGAQDVWIGTPITVVFSEAVVYGDGSGIRVDDVGTGEPVAHELAASLDGTSLTIRIAGRPDTPGQLRVTLGGIADAAGNALVDDPWTFSLPLWNRPDSLNLDPAGYGFRAAVEVDADGNT